MIPSHSVIICGFYSHCVELMILPLIQEAFVIEGVIWVISVTIPPLSQTVAWPSQGTVCMRDETKIGY